MEQRQIEQRIRTWQSWRSQQFEELAAERRRVSANAKSDALRVEQNPLYLTLGAKGTSEQGELDRLERRYSLLVDMDTRIKASIYGLQWWNPGKGQWSASGELPPLSELLAQAEDLMSGSGG